MCAGEGEVVQIKKDKDQNDEETSVRTTSAGPPSLRPHAMFTAPRAD